MGGLESYEVKNQCCREKPVRAVQQKTAREKFAVLGGVSELPEILAEQRDFPFTTPVLKHRMVLLFPLPS